VEPAVLGMSPPDAGLTALTSSRMTQWPWGRAVLSPWIAAFTLYTTSIVPFQFTSQCTKCTVHSWHAAAIQDWAFLNAFQASVFETCPSLRHEERRSNIIQFNSLLFMCRVNSYKANYRQHSVDTTTTTTTTIIIIIIIIIQSQNYFQLKWCLTIIIIITIIIIMLIQIIQSQNSFQSKCSNNNDNNNRPKQSSTSLTDIIIIIISQVKLLPISLF
jgi:hypothetical protein